MQRKTKASTFLKSPLERSEMWTNEKKEKLCGLWRLNANTFHVKNCTDRGLRNRTFDEMASTLGVERLEVKRMMMNMRTQYRRERRRTQRSVWRYFPMLRFLDKEITIRSPAVPLKVAPKKSRHFVVGSHGDGMDARCEKNTVPQIREVRYNRGTLKRPSMVIAQFEKKRKKLESKSPTSMPNMTPIMKSNMNRFSPPVGISSIMMKQKQDVPKETNPELDAHDVYARYIAMELRSIEDPQALRLAKLKIQKVLYEAQSGLSLSSVTSTLTGFVNSSFSQQQMIPPLDGFPFSGVNSPSTTSDDDLISTRFDT